MSTAAASFPSPDADARRRHVLVVDDDEAIRELFREVLSRAGFTVEVAENGASALRRLAEAPPDVVTLDLAMPEIAGFAVLDWLRALPAAPPIVIVSGAAYPEEMLSFDRPVVAYLPKPLLPRELVAACESALAGSHETER